MTVVTVFLAPYLTSIAEAGADTEGRIHPLGISVPPGSFFGYVLSVSVVLQVLVLPLTGAFADRSGHKRQLLAVLAFLGAACTMAMFFVVGGHYLLGAGLFVAANLSFGASIVVYYSWLPDLASPDERDKISSRGWAYGYLGGAALLAAHLALFTPYKSFGLTEGEAGRVWLASGGGRRGGAAGRQPGAVHPVQEFRADRGRGGPDLPGLGRGLVGGFHRRQHRPAAQPPSAGGGRRRGPGESRCRRHLPAARGNPAGSP